MGEIKKQMPSIALITKEGLDGVIDVPQKLKMKPLSESSALKAARIIYMFETQTVVNPNYEDNYIRDIAKRLQAGITVGGRQFAHELEMLKLRGRIQAGGSDYIIIRTKLSRNKLRKIKNPFEAALQAIYNATHIYIGDKNKLHKWIQRFNFELSQEESE